MNTTLPSLLIFLLACQPRQTEKQPGNPVSVDSAVVKNAAVDSNFKEAPQPDTAEVSYTYTLTAATEQAYKQALISNPSQLLTDTAAYSKNNGVIKLPTKNLAKPVVHLADALTGTDDVAIRSFRYLGQLPLIKHYLVEGLFWEHYECYLVDPYSGRITTLWNKPVLSPNAGFIANPSIAYGLEGTPNGIQIWQVKKQRNHEQAPFAITKVIEVDQQE